MSSNLFVQIDDQKSEAGEALATRSQNTQYLKLIRQRMSIVYMLLAVGTALAYVQNNVLFHGLNWPAMRNLDISEYMLPACILSCIIMAWITKIKAIPNHHLLTLGLCFQAIPSFFLAVPFYYTDIPVNQSHADITYVAVWILVFPILVPAKPWKTFVGGMVSATMPVLVYSLWRGDNSWEANHLLYGAFSSNYFCAIMGVVPSYLAYRSNLKMIRAQQSIERLGSYRLIRKLGAGGMGEVWEAKHMTLARPAAIKLIKARSEQNDEEKSHALRRFKREAKATAALSSPHTVSLFDYGINHDGTFYYVMELLHGMDLDTFVKDYGPASPNRTLYFLEQICDSLAEAHNAGLVHRDIKPGNLYLCHLGLSHDFVKVFDFGLVSEIKSDEQQQEEVKLTTEGNIIGTPAFLAPEMAQGQEIDQRADIYSLGCVAFWLLTGEYVFKAASPFQMVINHMSMAPEAPSSRARQPIPKELDDLILRCLSKAKEDRPENAEELRKTLKGILIEPWTEDHATRWWSANPAAQASVELTEEDQAKRALEETRSEQFFPIL
jgi:eukaryotic-like serine/threonine-protein kinase